jgi:hypothetical protein
MKIQKRYLLVPPPTLFIFSIIFRLPQLNVARCSRVLDVECCANVAPSNSSFATFELDFRKNIAAKRSPPSMLKFSFERLNVVVATRSVGWVIFIRIAACETREDKIEKKKSEERRQKQDI